MQIKAFWLSALIFVTGPLSAAEQFTLSAELEPLRPYIGKTCSTKQHLFCIEE